MKRIYLSIGLLANWLAWNTGSHAETINYDPVHPDSPFSGAWDCDLDCSDPDASHENDCWVCGGSPPEPFPKYSWDVTRECPSLKLKKAIAYDCFCDFKGLSGTASFTAPGYEDPAGKRIYTPNPDECGDTHDEDIGLNVEWEWYTSGYPTTPSAGKGETAQFDYVAPEGAFTIDVYFSAKGTPDDNQCGIVTDGPELCGTVSGNGVLKINIPKVSTQYPSPNMVNSLTVDGADAWGLTHISVTPSLKVANVCNMAANCIKYQIQGQFDFFASIDILSCITIEDEGCPMGNKGDCIPRDQCWIDATEKHEHTHYDAYREFADKWNQVIMDEPLYSTKVDAENRRVDILVQFNTEYEALKIEQHAHSGHEFDGQPTHADDGCGREYQTGTY